MIGIQSISSFIPDNRIDNISRAAIFDKPKDFINDKIGFTSLPRIEKEMETSDMCIAALSNLTTFKNYEKIDCLIVCTQNPDGYGLPSTAAIVHGKLNLPDDVAAFDISLGCSGYVYGLNIITKFMTGNGFKNGLLFTADPYSKVINANDYVTELLFGDAATCTLISEDPNYTIGKTLFATDGKKNRAISVDSDTKELSMDGKAVFNFTMRKVPQQILQCIDVNGKESEEIDLYILHQASKYIVDNIRKKISVSNEKLPFLAHNYGNTISSSIPLLLENYCHKGPNNILISGFGVGLSWASTVISRIEGDI